MAVRSSARASPDGMIRKERQSGNFANGYGRIPGLCLRQTLERVIAHPRLSQAVSPAAPSCSGRGAIEMLKKSSRHPVGKIAARQGCRACRDRDLVRRRSQDRTEERDHPSLGQTRHAGQRHRPISAPLPPTSRSHLSRAWQGCSAHPAAMQYRGDEPAAGRDRHSRRAWPSRRTPGRSGGMAPAPQLAIPPNITLMPLPAKCPELTWGDKFKGILLTASWLRYPTTVSDPRSEPFDMTRLVASSIKLTYGPRQNKRGTNIPPTAGKARVGETILNLGWLGQVRGSVAHPDLPGLIGSR